MICALSLNEFILVNIDNYKVVYFNSESKSTLDIFSQGKINAVLQIDNNLIALAKNESIQVINYKKNCISNILQSTNENFVDLARISSEKIISVSHNGIVRVWNPGKKKCLLKFKDEKENSLEKVDALTPNQILTLNIQERIMSIWDISQP